MEAETGGQEPPEAEKTRDNSVQRQSWSLWREGSPADTLIFHFWSLELLFSASKFVAVCYSSPRKEIQVSFERQMCSFPVGIFLFSGFAFYNCLSNHFNLCYKNSESPFPFLPSPFFSLFW